MTRNERSSREMEAQQLVSLTLSGSKNYTTTPPARWLLVDTHEQRVFLVRESTVIIQWPVSTAEVGLDNRENSGGTPPGWHRVAQKIGARAPLGTVFESREPTGEIWYSTWNKDADLQQSDLILSRILILDGLEPGINQGPGLDSRQRYIYVHGTNQEDLIGQPVSGGCVRMINQNIIDLFDQIEEGDLLVIV